MQIEQVPIDSLTPHPRNYRSHPDAQLVHLQTSLREYGWARNVVVSRDNVILAGHGIVEAARRNGHTSVPVFRLGLKGSDPRAEKFLVLENTVSHMAEDDDRQLTELLKELKDAEGVGLAGTGYDEQMLANLLFVTRPESEIADFNAAAEWVGMPEVEEKERETGVKLVVWFDDEDHRNQFMELNELVNVATHAKGRGALAAWWPTRDREPGAYKFEDGDE